MQVYVGIGSNHGDRQGNLENALRQFDQGPLRLDRVSPVVESPASLPAGSPGAWNRPYLNLVADCRTDASPQVCQAWCRALSAELSPPAESRWAPRALDLDLLIWGDVVLESQGLTLPRTDLQRRSFILSPLVALEPGLTLPGLGDRTVLDWSRDLPHHIPQWMGIVNLTPDSFSDGGRHQAWAAIEPLVQDMEQAGVHIIDLGAESTRPDAAEIPADEEWARLEPTLRRLLARYRGRLTRPRISVDTRHVAVAARALDLGADIINDVSGLQDPDMIALARQHPGDWIAMHSLTVPADRNALLPEARNPVAAVEDWLTARLTSWDSAGLAIDRIVFDPGIGFGKSAHQSLELMRHVDRLRTHGLRVLVGHSRKSFLTSFAGERDDSDILTVGASMKLCEQGADIIRVHDVPRNLAAYRAWSHLCPSAW
jgi:2-amino-4-hydroxy-6-hydroxymethyldihydropteridine diphosphokinase/dihydropteroate synthase